MTTDSEDRGPTSRSALEDAAREAFARRGYTAASTRAIADAAGVNVALIKYHFGGKRQLFDHVVGEACERSAAMVDEHVARVPARGSPLLAISAALGELARDDAITACLLTRSLLAPPGDPPSPTPVIVARIDEALRGLPGHGFDPELVRRAWLAGLLSPLISGPEAADVVVRQRAEVTRLVLGDPRSPERAVTVAARAEGAELPVESAAEPESPKGSRRGDDAKTTRKKARKAEKRAAKTREEKKASKGGKKRKKGKKGKGDKAKKDRKKAGKKNRRKKRK